MVEFVEFTHNFLSLLIVAHNNAALYAHYHTFTAYLTLLEAFDRLLVIAVAEIQVALYEVPIDCWVQLGILGDIVNCFLCVSIQEEGLASFEICFRKVVVEVDANCQIVLALLVVLERPVYV